MKLVAINENGKRMGEGHGRAKLTDHDVELVQDLLACRDMLVDEYAKQGLSRGHIHRVLNERQLSYAWIADKFEVSKSLIKAIYDGKVRTRVAVEWKRIECT
jgi:hypothetical protein